METTLSTFHVSKNTILRDSKITLENGTSYWIQKPLLACQSNFFEVWLKTSEIIYYLLFNLLHFSKALFTHEKKKEYFLPGIPESSFTQIQSWVLTQKMVFW